MCKGLQYLQHDAGKLLLNHNNFWTNTCFLRYLRDQVSLNECWVTWRVRGDIRHHFYLGKKKKQTNLEYLQNVYFDTCFFIAKRCVAQSTTRCPKLISSLKINHKREIGEMQSQDILVTLWSPRRPQWRIKAASLIWLRFEYSCFNSGLNAISDAFQPCQKKTTLLFNGWKLFFENVKDPIQTCSNTKLLTLQ